jgi:hypothetical protein
MMQRAFKRCPKCRCPWSQRLDFLADPAVRLVGYQVSGFEERSGLFLFNHLATGCGTTMALAADKFADLHDGPIFVESLRGSRDCPGHCLRENDLDPCAARCECRFVRDVMQVVRNWPKCAGARPVRRRRAPRTPA